MDKTLAPRVCARRSASSIARGTGTSIPVHPGIVLLDVRSPELFAKGHVPGAVNLPHAKIIESRMREYPKSTLFVTYCAGPHCNGAARGAARLARLGFEVKLMAGGMTGWIDEGFELERLLNESREWCPRTDSTAAAPAG